MNRLTIKKSLAVLVLGLTVSTHTLAWGKIVFDPSNFAKNTVTAMQQVKQTALQIGIKAEEVKQYQMMVQDLKQLNPSVIQQGVKRGYVPAGNYNSPTELANAAAGVYGSYEQIGNTMDGFNQSYNQMDDLMKGLDRTSMKSRIPPEKILQYDFQRTQKGIEQDGNYYTALQNLNKQLASHQKRTDSLAASIPAQSGTVELLQTLGSQNTILQDQMTHLIQVSTISAAENIQNSKKQKLDDELQVRGKSAAKEADSYGKSWVKMK